MKYHEPDPFYRPGAAHVSGTLLVRAMVAASVVVFASSFTATVAVLSWRSR